MNSSEETAFESWKARVSQGSKPLSDSSLRVYGAMWGAWCGWLRRNDIKWFSVTPEIVKQFLNGPAPSTANRRKALNTSAMSNYHRQRYWRVLHGVYGEAVRQDLIAINPAGELNEQERPHVSPKSRVSQILPPGVLKLLRRPDIIRSILKQDSENDWPPLRDRAIFALIAHAGLTTAEISALRGMDLRVGDKPLVTLVTGGQQKPLDGFASAPHYVDVANISGDVWRSLHLPADALECLLPWLSKRQVLLSQRARLSGQLLDRGLYTDTPLFPSRKSMAKKGIIEPMAPVSIYKAVNRGFEALYKLPAAAGLNKREEGVKVAQGAAIIRNSVLKEWLDTLGVQETVNRAGLKRQHSLRLLPEFNATLAI